MSRLWKIANRVYATGRFPLVMGILNVTPDSFSDGGRFVDVAAAVDHALALAEQGADLIDIGGESTRPGAATVDQAEELRRVIPVIQSLSRQLSVPISIDTYKAEVARQALDAGAQVVNDISGLSFDPAMINVCRGSDAGIVCMHIQGTPQTMQDNPHYENVVEEIAGYFAERLERLVAAGIDAERIVLDPGVGFGKTAQHNLEILANIARFQEKGRPVLIGHSRKRFLGKFINRKADERTFASVGVSVALADQGVDILRVHDVAAHRDALVAWDTINRLRPERL